MKLIGLTGYKQSGKDTVLQCIREIWHTKNVMRHNFADPLKQEIANACKVDIEFIEKHKPIFRTMMQWWGTDFRRNLYGSDYWVLQWGNMLNNKVTYPHVVVATDVRFVNEATIVRNLGGKLIRVTNPRTKSDGHASEVEQDALVVDKTINNVGTIQELKDKTRIVLQQLFP